MDDIKLIPTEDLINELKSRADHLVLAYCRHESGNRPIITTTATKEIWMYEVGLAEILKNDILNNFNGEIEFVHRIQDDYNENQQAEGESQ